MLKNGVFIIKSGFPNQKIKKKKAEYTAEYHARPGILEGKRVRSKTHYQQNKKAYKERTKIRRIERLEFTNRVALYYGCQNPDCSWSGNFQPWQLAFHHFNPSQKITEVSKMHSHAWDKIVVEINKCIVLCRNCHADCHCGSLVLNESMLCQVNENLEIQV